MIFVATIRVLPKTEVRDPQGEAVRGALRGDGAPSGTVILGVRPQDFEDAAFRGYQRQRTERTVLHALDDFVRQPDGLRLVASLRAVFDLNFHRVLPDWGV